MSRTVIISDLHLGPPDGAVRDAAQVRPVWTGCDRLILNGDCAELHHPEFKNRATHELMRLVELAAVDGVDVDILSGNHDPWLSATRSMTLAGGSILVTHGDALHPAIAPWVPNADLLRSAFEKAMADHERSGGLDGLEARLDAARQAAFEEWEALEAQSEKRPLWELLKRPWALVTILDYWRRVPKLAADFLAEHAPESRYLVFGHTHRPGVWTIDGRTLINTGSFDMPCRPRAVAIEGDAMCVHKIKKRGGVWTLAPREVARFDLDHSGSAV